MLGVLAIVVTFAWHNRGEGPRYKGRHLTVWLEGYRPWTGDAWMRADEAVRASGAAALPTLERMLRAEDTAFATESFWASLWLPFRTPLSLASHRHDWALSACKTLGPVAKPLLPLVVEHLRRGHGNGFAAHALAQIGPEGVAVLVESLADERVVVRVNAAHAFEFTPFKTNTAVKPLIRCLSDKDSQIREQAARSLGVMGLEPEHGVPALVGLLKDPVPHVRQGAIYGLGHYGPKAKSAIPALVELLKDTDEHVRFLARAYLFQIDEAFAKSLGL